MEQVADIFVPNDAHLIGGRGQAFDEERSEQSPQAISESENRQNMNEDGVYSIAVCTGANACGKACGYLQQRRASSDENMRTERLSQTSGLTG